MLNVGGETNTMAIQCYRRFEQKLSQFFLQSQVFADKLSVFVKRLVGWSYYDYPIEAVQQSILPTLQLSAGILQTHNGWYPQGPCHDCGMRCFAAHIGGKTQHVALI